MDLCCTKHGKNGSWVIQNRPGMPENHCGGHLASMCLLLRSPSNIFATFTEAGQKGLVLHKAWQKWIMGDPKQTRDARKSLWRTSGIPVPASEVTKSHFCHVYRGRQKWTCIAQSMAKMDHGRSKTDQGCHTIIVEDIWHPCTCF